MASLPYSGFSWSINQHIGPAAHARTIYELLQAAFIYDNDPNYRQRITEYLVTNGILTANVRQDAGAAQAWRDYQQILSELGFIVSTRYTTGVQVTPAGLMLLDGLIGYSELITTQALRYQYPNGHKSDISPRQKQALENAGINVPSSRTELDSAHGVLIKPAVLILRVLLELMKSGQFAARLSVDECISALVPISTNQNWELAVEEVLQIKQGSPPSPNSSNRRHVQEWYRLLKLTDIFEIVDGDQLILSQFAINNIESLEQLCEYHENSANFWIAPQTDERQVALSWFNYYGNPELFSQWVIPTLEDQSYIEQNYIIIDDIPDESPERGRVRNRRPEIRLQPYSSNLDTQEEQDRITNIDPSRMMQGRLRQRNSTRLHAKIVEKIAIKLTQANYHVEEDRNSVDLLATRDGLSTIIEVKTVNRRNLDQRIRLGVGQVLEYRYRLHQQSSQRPQSLLVLSSTADFEPWFKQYFSDDIHVGLVGFASNDRFQAYTLGEIEEILSS